MPAFDFKSAILGLPGASEAQANALVGFRNAVVLENKIQNLTRILDESSFFHENIRDAHELSRVLPKNAQVLDIGSGNGVPGLPLAIFREDLRVVLSDSEAMKADFLRRCVSEFSLSNVSVFTGRAELYLTKDRTDFLVARAVGPISRIYSWISECSTWNKIVLLKGPGWEEEWNSHESKKARAKLSIESVLEYSTEGAISKTRKIITLKKN